MKKSFGYETHRPDPRDRDHNFYPGFSLSDHLNVITTNINIYFDYIVVQSDCFLKLYFKTVNINQSGQREHPPVDYSFPPRQNPESGG